MNGFNNLRLYEEIMLLALRDQEGTVPMDSNYKYPVAGAIISELLLSKHIGIDRVKKKKFLKVFNSTPGGDPLIDECIGKINFAKRRATIETWVSRFVNIKNLKQRIAEQLCSRGILKADEDTILLIFKRKIYPEINPIPENNLIERMRKAIFTDTQDIDPRIVVIISLAKSADLLKMVFDKKELKIRKQRIEEIINGEVVGKATAEAIQAMQAAVMAACIVPVIASTACS